MAVFGSPRGGSVSQSLERTVQTAAAAPLLSPGSLRARSGPLLQPGRQACTARHHRVSTDAVKFDLKPVPALNVKSFYVFVFRYLLTRYAEPLGQFAAASQSCNFSLRFFHSNQKDVSRSVSTSVSPSSILISSLLTLLFTLLFFSIPSHQTSEYIIQAYKYGAFEKIPEFIALRNRLNQSLHFAQVRTERMLLDLFLEADM